MRRRTSRAKAVFTADFRIFRRTGAVPEAYRGKRKEGNRSNGEWQMANGRCFLINDEEVGVFRQRDGRVFAVQNRCPHRRGPLAEGLLGGGKVICPLHGHRFELQTGKSSEPKECVRTFRVTVLKGQIYIAAKPETCC